MFESWRVRATNRRPAVAALRARSSRLRLISYGLIWNPFPTGDNSSRQICRQSPPTRDCLLSGPTSPTSPDLLSFLKELRGHVAPVRVRADRKQPPGLWMGLGNTPTPPTQQAAQAAAQRTSAQRKVSAASLASRR